MNKIMMLAVLGSFALPLYAEETAKAEADHAAPAKEEKVAAPKKVKKAKKAKKVAAKKAQVKAEEAKAPVLPTEPTVPAAAPAVDGSTPDGYLKVNDSTFIGIHGMFKGVTNYDLNGFGGDLMTVGAIPTDSKPSRKQHLSMHAKASRIGIDALGKTTSGDVKTKIEFDFFKEAALATAADDAGSTSYALRLRHAFVTFKGFLAGQTDSLFTSYAMTPMVDFAGHFGGGLRQYQLRYTHDFSKAFSLAFGVENGKSDSQNTSPATTSTTASPYRESRMPDFTTKATVKFGESSIGFRGLVRQIALKAGTTAQDKSYRKTGYGVGIDAKIATMKNSGFVAMINHGNGIGRYIAEHDGQSSFLDTKTDSNKPTLKLQKMMEWGLGYSQALGESWSLNAGYSESRVTRNKAWVFTANQPTSKAAKLQRYFFNVMWTPAKDFTIGLEYAAGRKTTMSDASRGVVAQKGKRDRVILGVQYKF